MKTSRFRACCASSQSTRCSAAPSQVMSERPSERRMSSEGSREDLKENDLTDKWNTLQEDLRSAAANLKLAQSQEELTRLKERQSEIRYQSGAEPLPTWLAARHAILQTQKSAAAKALEYDEIVLNLRHFSGDLGNSYVDQNSWQK